MMKLIDRYIMKQFLQTLFFGLLAFIFIFVIIDMMENLDDFIDQSVASGIIFQYYLYFIPEIVKLMLPVSVLFAALFTSGKMSNLNELTALKAGGVSSYRYMLPILILTVLLSFFAVGFGGYAVPYANAKKLAITQQYLKKDISFAESNIFFQDTPTRIVAISYFDEVNNQAVQTSIQEFDPKNITRMFSRQDYRSLRFDSSIGKWKGYDGFKRIFTETGEVFTPYRETTIDNLVFRPSDLLSKKDKPEEMNLTRLRASINAQIRSGADPTRSLIEYHSRIAFAFTGFIVVLFGLPFSANKRRGGIALQIGLNILITFVYLVMMEVVKAFGKNGILDPLLTAWLVNIIFLVASLINLLRMKQ